MENVLKDQATPLLTSNVLVHVGLRKTGTTWLQNHLFGRDDTGFWSPSDFPDLQTRNGRDGSLKAIQKAYTQPFYQDSRGRFLPDEDFDLVEVTKQFQGLSVPVGLSAVFSNERLGGYPLSNGIDRNQVCKRIKQVFPNARILIVIREQRSMILSNYMQCLKHGGGYSIEQYINGKTDHSAPALTFHYFKYDRLVRLYQSVFGSQRVLVLPFELFREAPQEYVARICQFTGIETPNELSFADKSNERTYYLPFVALRRIIPIIRSSRANAYSPAIFGRYRGRIVHRWMIRLIENFVPQQVDEQTKKRLQKRIVELTQNTFAESNRETAKLIDIDLATLGYCV